MPVRWHMTHDSVVNGGTVVAADLTTAVGAILYKLAKSRRRMKCIFMGLNAAA